MTHVVLLVLFIAFMAALFVRRPLQERAAISSMPEDERRAVFQQEIAAFQTLCTNGSRTPLDDRCRERADFLQQFPECDATCRDQTDRFLAHGTR